MSEKSKYEKLKTKKKPLTAKNRLWMKLFENKHPGVDKINKYFDLLKAGYCRDLTETEEEYINSLPPFLDNGEGYKLSTPKTNSKSLKEFGENFITHIDSDKLIVGIIDNDTLFNEIIDYTIIKTFTKGNLKEIEHEIFYGN